MEVWICTSPTPGEPVDRVAVRYPCPRCRAKAGNLCITKSGWLTHKIHKVRVREAMRREAMAK